MALNTTRLSRVLLYPFLALIVPTPCAGCNELLGAVQHLGYCPSCWSSLEPDRFDLRRPLQRAATRYSGLSREILLEAKFRGRPELFKPMGRRMAAVCHATGLDLGLNLVVPVPAHPLRLLRRGYNPARELARVVARDLGLPLAGLFLRRKLLRHAPIGKAGREQRRLGAASAFCAAAGKFRNRHILLVDDILTTGSTFKGCRSALLAAGATSVRLVVWGRTPATGGTVAGQRGDTYNGPDLVYP